MRKTIIFTLMVLLLFFYSLSFTQVTFARSQSKSKNVTNKKIIKENKKKKTKTKTKTKTKKSSTSYSKCFALEMKKIKKEMQEKKQEALEEYKNSIQDAMSDEDKKEAKEVYDNSLKEIKEWFKQAENEAKQKCK